jgi:hypothetical protein
MGFRIETYAEAKSYGLEHLWPSKADKPAADVPIEPAEPKARTKTKLEIDFGVCADAAKERGVFREVWYEPMRFKVFGDRWYKPDYLTIGYPITLAMQCFWECKGYERAKDIQKLIAAADRYPWFTWVLVKREKRVWQCRYVNDQGISREVWRPDWLR